ncbi:TonB-dependent siderophore receptor [Govanella unica]|uniref:TonB-dependent siderophore receptor n=1 Tax=Govanella unica TaxID=2975056 RepID=A0A9X3Z7H5_9PROT|nr:TonB-dependent siderophore receptor [Govania unica]MDA5193984.1 TonB-dependent siderophore receptor [Govania unica]
MTRLSDTMTPDATQRAARRRMMLCGSTAILVAGMFAAPAIGQTQEEERKRRNELEEVIVSAPHYVSTGSLSATKTDAPLIETPQAVTVISRDQIDLLSWTSLQQSVRYTAGVSGENYGPDERYDWLTIRGFNPIQYIDGLQAPIGSVTNAGTDLYGSQSVDILKGPSSVLYGQTPPGGIVNMTSRRPEREWGGEVQGQYGSYNHFQGAGDITGPVSDIVSFRLTGLARDRGTQIDFVKSQRQYFAPAVTFDFSDKTRLTLLAYYQHDKVTGDSGGFLPAFGTLLPNPLGKIPVGTNLGEPDINSFKREQYAVGWDFSHQFNDIFGFQQNAKYFHADGKMKSVYGQGFVDNNFDGVPDDFRTVNRASFPFDEKISSYNIDNRLSIKFESGDFEHSVLVGYDYRRYSNNSKYGFASSTWPPGSVPTIDVFNPVYNIPFTSPVANIPYTNQLQHQHGVYLQDQIKYDNLILTLSGRQDMVRSHHALSKEKDDAFSYRVGLNYVTDIGIAPYIQAAKSFQPNSGMDIVTLRPFKPSTGQQIEAGIKYDGRNLPEGMKAFASIAAYKLKQKNMVTTSTLTFLQTQVGEVEVKGIEVEAVARFYERLSINAAYSYTDSKVLDSINLDEIGKQLMAVPKHKISLLVDYTFQTGPLAGLGAGVGGRYLSKAFGDALNKWPNESPVLFDALVHYDREDWRLALNANNVFNVTYVGRCSSAIDCFYGTKRVMTGTLTRKF